MYIHLATSHTNTNEGGKMSSHHAYKMKPRLLCLIMAMVFLSTSLTTTNSASAATGNLSSSNTMSTTTKINSASCMTQVRDEVTSAYQTVGTSLQLSSGAMTNAGSDMSKQIKTIQDTACKVTVTFTVTPSSVDPSLVSPPPTAQMSGLSAKAYAKASYATRVFTVYASICDHAPGGCGIWSASNSTTYCYNGLWSWECYGPPVCHEYTVWYVVYNQENCYFPYTIAGLFEPNAYLLSRDMFNLKFGINVFGQLLMVGPYYHNLYFNIYPNGRARKGSNNL